MSKVMPVSEAGGPHLMNADAPDDNGLDEDFESQLSPEDEESVKKMAADLLQKREDTYSALARAVEGTLTSRMGTRKAKENQWLEAMRIYLGSLSSYNIVTGDYPFGTKNETGMSHRPEFSFIRTKCNMAIAQTTAHQFAAGDKNWDINPPQVLDLDAEDMQTMAQLAGQQQITPEDAVRMKCTLMENEIEYHLEQTDYALEARRAMWDRVVLGTGILKGPLNAGKLKKIYRKQQTSDGKTIRIPDYTVDTTPLIYRVNPWYFFPDDTVTDIAKAENSIEVHPKGKQDLLDLTKHPGYIKDQIEKCLTEEPRTYINSPFNDPAYLTQGINLLKGKYLVIEYHGPIKKADLELMGVEHQDNSPMDEIYAEVWVVNSRVIRLQLEPLEGCTHVPYYCCVWEPDPATIFGFGIPMLARDQQRVVNESYKMILDNAGVSAGPQVVVDTTIIKPADGDMACTPFKVWYAQEYGADLSKAINFFMPQNAFEGLSALVQLARGFADEESGINLYMGNSGTPAGAADNATGMALINENAMTPLFFKSEEWDDNVTRRLITDIYDWEMQYNPKEEIKGTYCVDVRTTTAYLKNTMELQQLERLGQEITQGSPLGEWINMDELAQARFARMKLPSSNIVKTAQQVAQERQQKAQQPPQPDPNMLKAQAMMQQAQTDQQRLALDQQKMQTDAQTKAADNQMKLQTAQITAQSNTNQHQLDLQRAAIEQEGIRTQAAVKVHATQAQANATLQTNINDNATTKQLAGLKHVEHFQSLQQKQQEIDNTDRQATQANEIKLRTARVNAQAREKATPNRNLTKHNPKPK